MKASIFTTLILAAFHLSSHAQDEEKAKTMALNTGLSVYSVKDLTQSPYTLSKASVPISFIYTSANEKRKQSIEISFDSFVISAPVESPFQAGLLEVEGIFGTLSYQWLKSMPGWQPFGTTANLGAAFNTSVFSRDRIFRGSPSENTGELIATISPKLLLSKSLGKNSINWELALPLFTYNLASSYNPRFVDGDQNRSQLLFWNKMFDVESEVFYSIIGRSIIDLGYSYRYYEYDKGLKVQVARHQILTRISFKP